MSRVTVSRPGKNPGISYDYWRFVHYRKVDKRKKEARRTYCYVPIKPAKNEYELDDPSFYGIRVSPILS